MHGTPGQGDASLALRAVPDVQGGPKNCTRLSLL